VEFRDGYEGPCAENLFGLVREPFSDKTEYLDRLISTAIPRGLLGRLTGSILFPDVRFTDSHKMWSICPRDILGSNDIKNRFWAVF
jgi:hypothetical protein